MRNGEWFDPWELMAEVNRRIRDSRNRLDALGWIPVSYEGVEDDESVRRWLKANIVNKYELVEWECYFEDEGDATWFALQWRDAKEPESDLMQVLRQYVSLTNIV